MAKVLCRCVHCKAEEWFDPIPTDIPMCPKCYSPMVALEVVGRPA